MTDENTHLPSDSVVEAAKGLLEYADLMPKETPAPGGASTVHQFGITAGAVWTLAERADKLRKALAAQPRDDVRDAWSRCELIAYSHQQSDLKVRVANSADMTMLVTTLAQAIEAGTAETGTGSVHESASCKVRPDHVGDEQPDTDGLADEVAKIIAGFGPPHEDDGPATLYHWQQAQEKAQKVLTAQRTDRKAVLEEAAQRAERYGARMQEAGGGPLDEDVFTANAIAQAIRALAEGAGK